MIGAGRCCRFLRRARIRRLARHARCSFDTRHRRPHRTPPAHGVFSIAG